MIASIVMRFSPTPWLVATLAFVILGFTRGLHSSFGVFYVALLDAFGWSRGATAGVFSVVLTVDAILSPVIGCLWQLYIFFGLISAIGIIFTGMVPHVFLVSEWFVANRASAIGFVYAGTGVGILLLAPLSEWLLSTWGWPRAFQTFSGIVLLLLLPLVWIFYLSAKDLDRRKSRSPMSIAGRPSWRCEVGSSGCCSLHVFFAASGTTV